MKQKYTLVIADVEMNVVTDASRETVDKIVGILDRKMRDINLKSHRCTKNQAALLCALEYCAEKLSLQERNAELEEIAEQDEATIEAKNQKIAELEAEVARLQGENEVMNSILERAAASTKHFMGHNESAAAASAAEQSAEKEATPVAAEAEKEPEQALKEVEAEEPVKAPEEAQRQPEEELEAPEQLTVDFEDGDAQEESVNTKAAQVIGEIAEQSAAPVAKAKAKKTKNRSRVGSMFDLLTFNDV